MLSTQIPAMTRLAAFRAARNVRITGAETTSAAEMATSASAEITSAAEMTTSVSAEITSAAEMTTSASAEITSAGEITTSANAEMALAAEITTSASAEPGSQPVIVISVPTERTGIATERASTLPERIAAPRVVIAAPVLLQPRRMRGQPFRLFAIIAEMLLGVGAAHAQVSYLSASRGLGEAPPVPAFTELGEFSRRRTFEHGMTSVLSGQTSFIDTHRILVDHQVTISGQFSVWASGVSQLDARFEVGPEPVYYSIRGRAHAVGTGSSGQVRQGFQCAIGYDGGAGPVPGANCIDGSLTPADWHDIRDTLSGETIDVTEWCACGTLFPGRYVYTTHANAGWAESSLGFAAQVQFFPFTNRPVIMDQPVDVAGCRGCEVTETVEPWPCATGNSITWEISGWGWDPPERFEPLVDGPNYPDGPGEPPVICAGQGTKSITIRNAPGGSETLRRIRVRLCNTNGCTTSDESRWNSCPPDINWSGDLSVQDIFDFLAAYFAGESAGDFNGVGGLTVQDIFDFLAAYFAGCA